MFNKTAEVRPLLKASVRCGRTRWRYKTMPEHLSDDQNDLYKEGDALKRLADQERDKNIRQQKYDEIRQYLKERGSELYGLTWQDIEDVLEALDLA